MFKFLISVTSIVEIKTHDKSVQIPNSGHTNLKKTHKKPWEKCDQIPNSDYLNGVY